MKYLYLLTQSVPIDVEYDYYDSCVVCADSPEEARLIHPIGLDDWDGKIRLAGTWCGSKDVEVTPIGIASNNVVRGVVCASFNAG